jgi:hypothetical protein
MLKTRTTGLLLVGLALLTGAGCASAPRGGVNLPDAPKQGKSATSISGCLIKGSRSSDGADNFSQAGAEVLPIPGGVVVTHNLIHGCGLEAEVTASTEREMVVVREHLTGEVSGCDCPSTVQTAVGLRPGTWIVRLLLDTPSAHDQIIQDWDVQVSPP